MGYRGAGLIAAVYLSCLPTVALTEAVPTPPPERTRLVAAARAIMEKARFCSLITLGRDGHPQARIVDPFAPEPDLTVWIATNPITRKVAEIRADSRVTLVWFDPSGPGYVTLLARAELITDATRKAQHWKDDWTAFYQDKYRGEDFILIRCKPIRLELVSHGDGILNDPKTWRPVAIDFPSGAR